MSSILEALRELESSKPPAVRSRVAWPGAQDEDAPAWRRAAEILGIVALGLVLGGGAFGIVVWLAAVDDATPPAAVPEPPSAVAPAAPNALGATAPAPPLPGWLARLGPPKGRVAGDPTAASGARAAAPVARGAGLTLVGIVWDESRAGRTATLRIAGTPVTLREGESADGIEVQLITRDGAYVRRGAEVLMLEPQG